MIVDRGVADGLDDIDPDQIGLADLIYVTASAAAIRRIALAGSGCRIVAGIEAGMADDERLGRVLGHVNLVLTNSAGWSMLARQAAGAVPVIETRGYQGAVIHTPSLPDQRIPGIRVEAVDATGAGDCFAGALCHYLASGLELPAACELAVAASGLSTRRLGAQGALPADAEVRAAAARRSAPAATPGDIT